MSKSSNINRLIEKAYALRSVAHSSARSHVHTGLDAHRGYQHGTHARPCASCGARASGLLCLTCARLCDPEPLPGRAYGKLYNYAEGKPRPVAAAPVVKEAADRRHCAWCGAMNHRMYAYVAARHSRQFCNSSCFDAFDNWHRHV